MSRDLCNVLVPPPLAGHFKVFLVVFSPQLTELRHNKSLSLALHLLILKNSAILFSNYINNSRFVLCKVRSRLHT